jgi:hypothetical protein
VALPSGRTSHGTGDGGRRHCCTTVRHARQTAVKKARSLAWPHGATSVPRGASAAWPHDAAAVSRAASTAAYAVRGGLTSWPKTRAGIRRVGLVHVRCRPLLVAGVPVARRNLPIPPFCAGLPFHLRPRVLSCSAPLQEIHRHGAGHPIRCARAAHAAMQASCLRRRPARPLATPPTVLTVHAHSASRELATPIAQVRCAALRDGGARLPHQDRRGTA